MAYVHQFHTYAPSEMAEVLVIVDVVATTTELEFDYIYFGKQIGSSRASRY
jgi:hypothetical protein